MAATRLIPLHANKGRTLAQSLSDRTDYAKNPEKTEKGELVTAYHCDPFTVDEEFMLAVYFDVSTDYLLMGRDYVNLHSRKRLEGVLQELSGIIADLQDV